MGKLYGVYTCIYFTGKQLIFVRILNCWIHITHVYIKIIFAMYFRYLLIATETAY